ncbi:MAG: hypothetical protein V7K41_22210 [Nostoc sp.]|uniref:hypothetical protein n=1 Tax=Nostoc sp. TaxID=1180 RepID=UPI002FF7F6C4
MMPHIVDEAQTFIYKAQTFIHKAQTFIHKVQTFIDKAQRFILEHNLLDAKVLYSIGHNHSQQQISLCLMPDARCPMPNSQSLVFAIANLLKLNIYL